MRGVAHLPIVLLPGALLGLNAAELPPPAQAKADFARDIKPLFDRSCISCHGPEKPKSGFRLDSREAALRGGEHGKAILPGDSANSPLVLVVAGAHPDIERMPPKGKGDPLTPQEISLLRAWIDQGAEWPQAALAGPQTVAVAMPELRWISVNGDEHKFREHFWMKEGFHAGLQSFFIEDNSDANSRITMEGRLYPDDEDFRLALRYDRFNVGFIDVGFDEYRKYYDDSGGYYPFARPIFSLSRELGLRTGRAWIDFGRALPDAPKLTVGYEYQFRQGTKSTLEWGPVTLTLVPVVPPPPNVFARNIYPAFKDVDEGVHIVKFDASHEIDGLYLEDNFRAEFYDLKTQRHNDVSMTAGQTAPSQLELLNETHNEFLAVNALHMEKELRDWWLVSAGYLYSTVDADASFKQTTLHQSGLPISGDFWRTHSIILSQHSLLLNANTRLGPWEHVTFSAGVQSEWVTQAGIGGVEFDTGLPPVFATTNAATLDANLHKHTLQEQAALRYTGLPFTAVFAEGRLEQSWAGNFEEQIGGHDPFIHDTDIDSNLQDWRAGFYSAPLPRVSFGGHFRYRDKRTDYDDNIDNTAAYPAFITERDVKTREVEAYVAWRPLNWLKTKLSYQLLDTDFHSATDPIPGITPGGPLQAGTFNADVYGLNLVLTPFSRWSVSGTFNYYDSRSGSAHNDVPSVQPYRGDIYSAVASTTYMLSTNTDLTATYSFSRAAYAQNNFAAGLPLGIGYDWHVVQAGISRRFRHVTANLQYAFYDYAEPSTRGFNDYTAHAIFATITIRWP